MFRIPVCIQCKKRFVIKKNEVLAVQYVDEIMEYVHQILMADLWSCPKCGHEILHGFGKEPVAERFEPEKIARWMNGSLDIYKFY